MAYEKKSAKQDHAQITITGNIGKVKDLVYLPSGTAVLNFSVANSDDYKKDGGEIVERTIWYDVSVFGKRAEGLAGVLPRVSQVLVTGKPLSADAYINKNGQPQASNRIEVNFNGDVKFLKWKDAADQAEGGAPAQDAPADDIPF